MTETITIKQQKCVQKQRDRRHAACKLFSSIECIKIEVFAIQWKLCTRYTNKKNFKIPDETMKPKRQTFYL